MDLCVVPKGEEICKQIPDIGTVLWVMSGSDENCPTEPIYLINGLWETGGGIEILYIHDATHVWEESCRKLFIAVGHQPYGRTIFQHPKWDERPCDWIRYYGGTGGTVLTSFVKWSEKTRRYWFFWDVRTSSSRTSIATTSSGKVAEKSFIGFCCLRGATRFCAYWAQLSAVA